MSIEESLGAEINKLALPVLQLGPYTLRIGQVRCVLRKAEVIEATRSADVQVSPRIKEPSFALANGETVIVTTRKGITRPADVAGVLFRDETGGLEWQSHQAIDEMEEAASGGWEAVVQRRFAGLDGKFFLRAAGDAGEEGLRPPQIGALHAIGAHWSIYDQPATIVMPTGTGKTETMLSALALYLRKPLLVVVPSLPLRGQTARKFLEFGILRKLGVLAPDAPNPIVGVVTKIPKTEECLEMFERCNVIVATMDVLADAAAEPVLPEIVKRVGCLIIDEAHHVAAPRWSRFREAFASRPILQFTATPFRRDGHIVDGLVIYNYPLRMAQQDKYFKPIKFEPVYEPQPLRADDAVAEAAVERLREDLANGLNHLMMARCDTIARAEAVHKSYQRLAGDLNPILVHSDQTDTADRIERLRSGASRIAVCVNMLGEGFDLPQLKIAAVHDLHKSLAILLQFTGRFTRTAPDNIGDATVIANIAEPNVSTALERLYAEDADWNELLSEMSSDAAQEHAKLVTFLNAAQRLDKTADDGDVPLTHMLLRPTLSAFAYAAESFSPKSFHEALPSGTEPYRVWLHTKSNSLFFVTRTEPRVQWARSKRVRDRRWTLYVLHYDAERGLLYVSCSDKKQMLDGLAAKVGGAKLITGDVVFRAMGNMTRLIFQNVGVKKHGRRNLSYASYSGAEVATALGLAEKSGSVKAMLRGIGWEGGRQVTIGCSAKGRVWSREFGTVPALIEWCEHIGAKLTDESIDTTKLLDNVLLPTVVTALPDVELLGVDWPAEIIRQAEGRVAFIQNGEERQQTTFDINVLSTDAAKNAISFELVEAKDGRWAVFEFSLSGPQGFEVNQTEGDEVTIEIGRLKMTAAEYFCAYPPLFRFVDLSELDANLLIVPQSPYELTLDEALFEPWDWSGVDITTESFWKDGARRDRSVQWHVAQQYIQNGYDVVFDDDASGEAADLVCIKGEADHVRVALVHCKFSGADTSGARVADVVEVSSQAVRSARWIGRFTHLSQHLKARNDTLRVDGRPTRFLRGNAADLNRLVKLNRFVPVKPEIVVVQPGLSKANKTAGQAAVLAAAVIYLKETVGVDLSIVCSD